MPLEQPGPDGYYDWQKKSITPYNMNDRIPYEQSKDVFTREEVNEELNAFATELAYKLDPGFLNRRVRDAISTVLAKHIGGAHGTE